MICRKIVLPQPPVPLFFGGPCGTRAFHWSQLRCSRRFSSTFSDRTLNTWCQVDTKDINRPQGTQRNHSCARETKETNTIKNGTITENFRQNRVEASFTLHFTCGFDRSSSVPNIQTHANKLFNLHTLHVLIYFTPAFALDACHTM